MISFVESMVDAGVGPMALGLFLVDRDNRFREMNDKTWGKGNWIRCSTCLDSLGYPAYHHKDAHD